MRVLGISKGGGAMGISVPRLLWPLRELNKRPDFFCRAVGDTEIRNMILAQTESQLDGYDLYVFSRVQGQGPCPFEKALAQGARFVYETDDDLTDDYRAQGWEPWVRQTVAWCDAVTTSTEPLADQMGRYKKPVYVLPNYIDTTWYSSVSQSTRRIEDGLTIGLAGTQTHFFDWCEVLEALIHIREKYPHVNVACLGYKPAYMDQVPGLIHFAPVPFQAYPALLRQIDIRLCPLDMKDRFNYSKSDIAAIEAMAAGREVRHKRLGGAIPVCGRGSIYEQSVQDGVNGLLVEDGGWEEGIERLITDKGLRTRLSVQGYNWVRENRDLAQGTRLWAEAYKEIGGMNDG